MDIKLSLATQDKIINIFNQLLIETKKRIETETIESILDNQTPLTIELFSENIEEYIYFRVAQRVTTSFSTRLGKVMEKICEILIISQGGKILKNPRPYDLKFRLPDDKEYWIEIKSINGQNSSNLQTIDDRRKNAEKKGKIFKLCIYNDETKFVEDYKLNGVDFWDFIVGYPNAKEDIFKLIYGKAKEISIIEIISESQQRLFAEYKKRLILQGDAIDKNSPE